MSDSMREEPETKPTVEEHKVEWVTCDRNVKTEPADEDGGEDEFVYGGTFEATVEEKPDGELLSVGEMKKELVEEQETDFALPHMMVETEIIETAEKIFPDWPEEELMESGLEADCGCLQDPLSTSVEAVVTAASSRSQSETDMPYGVRFQKGSIRRHTNVRIHAQEEDKSGQTRNTQQLNCDLSKMGKKECIKILGDRPKTIQQDSLSCHNGEVTVSTADSLDRHQSTQKVVKHYKCKVCGASFGTSGQLKFHNYVHTGEKPYKCDKCDVRFTQPSSVKQHQSVHVGVKPHKCSICGVCFRTFGNLRQHENTHIKEMPHKCDTCGLRFRTKITLSRHQRIHPREKTNKCRICGACFSQSDFLERHGVVHAGKKL